MDVTVSLASLFFFHSLIYLFKMVFILFINGCAESFLLHRLFSRCRARGLLFVAVHRLLTEVALLLLSTGSRARGLQQQQPPGSRAQACGVFPGLGIEPASPVLPGTLLSTEPPGRPSLTYLLSSFIKYCVLGSETTKINKFPLNLREAVYAFTVY